MSLASWKREFYGPLKEACKSDMAALLHSKKKWEGLLRENIERHNLELDFFDLKSARGAEFQIDTSTCALCKMYYPEEDNVREHKKCPGCPLSDIRNLGCDTSRRREVHSPFADLRFNGPGKMLKLIDRAIAKCAESK